MSYAPVQPHSPPANNADDVELDATLNHALSESGPTRLAGSIDVVPGEVKRRPSMSSISDEQAEALAGKVVDTVPNSKPALHLLGDARMRMRVDVVETSLSWLRLCCFCASMALFREATR